MEIIPQKIKKIALKEGITFVVVAQMNNYSQKNEHKLAETDLAGISNGKKLNSVAQTTIILTRKKEDHEHSKILNVNITKAREGTTGTLRYDIDYGYNLLPHIE